MGKVKIGSAGVLQPPPTLNTAAFLAFEAQGHDVCTLFDQLCYTVPRSIWTPDIVPAAEHFDIDTWMDPFPLMALAAQATSKIELCLTAVDVARRVPAELAKTFLTIDHISEGRTWFSVGAGETKQFAPYGLERNKPFTRLEETIKVMKRLWETEGPIDYEGPIWKMHNAILGLRPYGEKPPKLLVAGGPGRALKIAGREADGWVSYLPPCGDGEWYTEQVATVRRHAEEAGRDPDELLFAGCFLCIIDQDEDAVDSMTHNLAQRWDAAATVPNGNLWRKMGLENPLGNDWSYSRDLVPMDWSREDALKIANAVPPEAVRANRLCGTPKQVADQLQPYIDAGMEYVLIANYAPLMMTGGYGGSDASMLELFAQVRARNNVPAPALA